MNKTIVAQQAKTENFLPSNQGVLQRKCACGNQTIGGGECAECGKKKMGLQRKLTIGASNDPLEREADRVAEQVMAAPVHSAVNKAPLRIQRYAGQASESAGDTPASVDRVLASSGRPMEPVLRQNMEQRFGHDFSQVRVHSGAAAEQSAREVSANAYTLGHNIVFGTGQLAPRTHEGQRLIAHELTHVVQQQGQQHYVQRWSFGSGRVPHSDYSEVPTDERARVTAAMSIIEKVKDHPKDWPRCHNFYKDNCTGGTTGTFKQKVDNATIWFDKDDSVFGSGVNPDHVAYSAETWRWGKWTIAGVMIHEMMHRCGQDDETINDRAITTCGVPDIDKAR